jgi:hypothetical protein
MNFIPLPEALHYAGLFGGRFYASFPLSLPIGTDGEPAFVLSTAFLAVRTIYLVVGVALVAASVRNLPKSEVKPCQNRK